MKKLTNYAMLLLAVVGMGLLAGCSDDEDNPIAPTPDGVQVRVAHLSPDAPNVDVYVNGGVALTDVPFQAISAYLPLAAGSYDITVYATGTTTNPVIDENLSFVSGKAYTVAATGLLNGSGDQAFAPAVYEDDLTADTGKARVRLLHASPDAPNVDITLTDGTVLLANVPFRQASNYLPVDPGTYDLQVRVAGTETVALSFGGVPLSGGAVLTVVANGLLSDASLNAIAAADVTGENPPRIDLPAATAQIRVGHLSPDAPNVDVWLNGAIVQGLTDVPFGVVSGYLEVSAATNQITVYATGTQSNPVIDAPLTFNPNQAYSILATGLLNGSGDQAFGPIVLMDDRSIDAMGNAKVRFVHTSPDAPAVDIVLKDSGAVLFGNVSFREAGDYLSVAGGSYDLQVQLASTKAPVLDIDGVMLDGSTNYTVFAIGLAGDETLAALPVVDSDM